MLFITRYSKNNNKLCSYSENNLKIMFIINQIIFWGKISKLFLEYLVLPGMALVSTFPPKLRRVIPL